jgi:hypothetical protein
MVIQNVVEDYDLKSLLAILNSRAISFWFYFTFDKFSRKIFPQFKVKELAIFPIPKLEKQTQKSLVRLVELLDSAQIEKQKTSNPRDLKEIEREIKTTDKKIDNLVYELYGLTEEEIAIVEGSFKET